MARRNTQKLKPISINKFYGLNEAVGKTEIKLGEWVDGYNVRVTKNYKPQKRPGHHTFIDFGTGEVQGLFECNLNGTQIMLVCHGGNVYRYDMSVTTTTTAIADLITEGTVTTIGTIADVRTQIFWMNSTVYFKNSTDYKQYDGTTYQDIVTDIPLIAINAPMTGGGTLFEEVNMLDGRKKQSFIGDGVNATITLAENDLDSIDSVTVDGVSASFTPNLVTGQATISPTPPNNAYVEVQWDKANATNVALIKNHPYVKLYGYNNDTNLFLFGNTNEKNVFRFSAIGKPGYFPANSFVKVKSDQFAITDLVPQYQSLIVYKEFEAVVVNPSVNPNYATNTGLNPFNFGYEGFNDRFGNIAPNMVQLIKDSPVTLTENTLRLWSSIRGVRNEVEPEIISERIKLSLQEVDLSTAVTFDYEFQKEYWVNVDNIVYIWNYGNDTMYKYTNIKANMFINVRGEVYYGGTGTVEHVSENFLSDLTTSGDTIPCKIYGGFSDFGTPHLLKNSRDQWLSIASASKTSAILKFATNRTNEEEAKTSYKAIEFMLFDYGNIDYGAWTYDTNQNVQPNRMELRVYDFTYIQWIIENDTNNESLTVLSLDIIAHAKGYAKRR